MIDLLVFIFGVLGAVLLIYKNKWGFISFVAHSSMWLYLSLISGHYWAVLTCIVFIIIDLYGYQKWSVDESPDEAWLVENLNTGKTTLLYSYYEADEFAEEQGYSDYSIKKVILSKTK